MRRIVLRLFVVMLAVWPSLAAAQSTLFFSEYAEGSSNNKALEIYNPTDASVSLSGWQVRMYFNGSVSPGLSIALSGDVAPGSTFVIAHASSNPALLAVAQMTNGSGWFNGDDAVVLEGPAGVVDVIGQIGVDPGSQWGAGDASTADNTIRRKSSILSGDPNGSDPFDPAVEWDGFPNDTWTGFGTHSVDTSSPTSPSATGSATPASVLPGAGVDFSVSVTPGTNPPSSGLTVTGDLSAIGGASSQPFADQGDGTFTFSALVPSYVTPGDKSIPVTVSDDQGRSGSASIALTVQMAAGPVDHVVISQVYGGGGNSGAVFNRDFVELFNPTSSVVDLTGWSLQYTSSTGDSWGNFNTSLPLAGIIGPGQYYLAALAGGSNGSDLPEANILGQMNMSGTTGKIALVRNTDLLSGTCPLSDADVVDFVGWGSANCYEGSAAAPSTTNSTAILRQNGGSQDTNQNGSDFFRDTPSPRRTAPIMEVGPSVANTDPSSGGFNTPRDASLTVTFTEAVVVDGAWFAIDCASSGAHYDATIAGTGKLRVITPNANFVAGESCTATIFALGVRDEDTDDAAPGTDHLAADHSWTFTVASGALPAYPADVHLTMGNPSGAVEDVNVPDNYLMIKPEYALSYDRDAGGPNWVSWHLSDEWVGTLSRFDTFRPDPQVPADWYRVQAFDFSGSGFDRGHMVPSADRDPETSRPINQATFLMSNMIPQAPDNNQGPWANMENYLRTLLPANELYVVAGGAGVGGTGFNGFATTVADGRVAVPAWTWKVALVLPKGGGDDAARVTAADRTIAVIMPNVQGIRTTNPDDWRAYLVSVDQVEALTGYDFFSNVAPAVQNAIEAGVDGVNPPGAADQSVGVTEDVAESFVLDAVSPGGSLTYELLTSPSHGVLTGDGGARTYTPAPDFHGSDSFTYRVSDGTRWSGTATVSIAISEVNDAPVAGNDAMTMDDNTDLTFSAADLLGNDLAGPANESGQTLSVTAVTATGSTHGTVSLSGGTVTYVPAPDYSGSASFAYTVCDDGTTAGSADPQCAAGTVELTILDTTAPVLSAMTPSVTHLWPVNHKMVDVAIAYTVADAGDPAPSCALTVSSNEPVNGTGDGDTAPDWVVIDDHRVQLRAERAGTGTGRIYTVTARCTDASGNFAERAATIAVARP